MGAQRYLTTYDYDSNNRLLMDTTKYSDYESINNYTYDANGNQLSKFESKIGESEAIQTELSLYQAGVPEADVPYQLEINEYDAFNRLVKVTTNTAVAEYEYKADGLRYSKTVDGQERVHVWDGANIVLEADETGSTIDTYIRGINLIKSGSNGYYTYNAHGDVVGLTDNTGIVTKTYIYDAFGVETDKDEADENPFRYCGEYTDLETGSIYLRARYYNPTTGGFMSEDPIRDGLNWYIYGNNNPIMYGDRDGLRTYIINGINNSSAGAPPYSGEFKKELEKLGVEDVHVIPAYMETNSINGTVEAIAETFNNGKYTEQAVAKILADLKDSPLGKDEQLNLIGYSGGGIIAVNIADALGSQTVTENREIVINVQGIKINTGIFWPTTIKYSARATIDNIILIGSPVVGFKPKNVKHIHEIGSDKDILSNNTISGKGVTSTTLKGVNHSGKNSYFTAENIGNIAAIVKSKIK